jgi:phosphoglycolate phosphatase
MKKDDQEMDTAQKIIPRIKAVIFDFDGTLAELHIDFGKMRSAIADVLDRYHLAPSDFDHLYILEIIKEAERRISESSPERGKTFRKDAMVLIENMEIEAAGRSSLFGGVKEMLLDIKKKTVSTGIITRNCHRSVQIVFPDYGEYVDALISREMTHHVKPDPRHLQEILSLLNISADRVLMVGDHQIDIQIGKYLGTYTAAVLTGTGKDEDLRHTRPDFLLQNVLEIKDIITSVNHEHISHLNTSI